MLKKIVITSLFVFVLLASHIASSIAGDCGGGKVLSMLAGAFNTDDLYVLVDNSKWPNQHPGTLAVGRWVVYQKNHLDPVRFKNISAMAVSTMIANSDVWTYTHNNSCSDATEFGIGTR